MNPDLRAGLWKRPGIMGRSFLYNLNQLNIFDPISNTTHGTVQFGKVISVMEFRDGYQRR